MMWQCWVPDDGYSRGDFKHVIADDAQEAAETFAQRYYEGTDHFSALNVRVAAWGSDASSEKTFRVVVDFDPSFHAREV